MAVVTTHTLNSVDGTHAAGIGVTLLCIGPAGQRNIVFERETDAGGRLSQAVDVASGGVSCEYELVFRTGAYFDKQALPAPGRQILKEIVIRFGMPDPTASYHIPLMLAPNSYSVWWSS